MYTVVHINNLGSSAANENEESEIFLLLEGHTCTTHKIGTIIIKHIQN